MKGVLLGLVLGFWMLAAGCGTLDAVRDRQVPSPGPPQAQDQQVAPLIPPDALMLPPLTSPNTGQLAPYWFWADKQQLQFDRYLQQQWNLYYQNRQAPPQFTRPPICNSLLLGGQVITTCH